MGHFYCASSVEFVCRLNSLTEFLDIDVKIDTLYKIWPKPSARNIHTWQKTRSDRKLIITSQNLWFSEKTQGFPTVLVCFCDHVWNWFTLSVKLNLHLVSIIKTSPTQSKKCFWAKSSWPQLWARRHLCWIPTAYLPTVRGFILSKFEHVLRGCAEGLGTLGPVRRGGGRQSPVQSRGGALYRRVAGLGPCTGNPPGPLGQTELKTLP